MSQVAASRVVQLIEGDMTDPLAIQVFTRLVRRKSV